MQTTIPFVNEAPIGLFVYNRIEHTQRVVEALKANSHARRTDLLIFSDAPRADVLDVKRVAAVREYLRTIDGFHSITLVERTVNLGLSRSFIEGISKITDLAGRTIILEDDNVVAPFFLDYVNAGLQLYANEERVAAVNGYLYPFRKRFDRPFFIRGSDVWGFGVWQRSWKYFEPDAGKLQEWLVRTRQARRFDYDGAYPFTTQLGDYVQRRNDSWSTRWHASAYLNGMYTLFPNRSLVRNIGFDGTGTHCDSTDAYETELSAAPVDVQLQPIRESKTARREIIRFHRGSHRRGALDRIGRMVHRVHARLTPHRR